MRTRRACLALALAGLASGAALAQRDIVPDTNISKDPFAWALFTYDGESDVNLKGEPGAEDASAWMADADAVISFPVCTNSQIAFLAGGGFRWTRFEFDKIPGVGNYDVYTITVPIDVVYSGLKRWTFWANVTPGLFSDLDGLTSDDYRTQAHGMVMFDALEGLALSLGVSYDRVFGEDQLYPLGGVVWTVTPEWQLRIILPQPAVVYAPTRRLAFFAEARPAGGLWNIRDSLDGEDYDLSLKTWQVGGGMEFAVVEHVWVHLAGGMDVNREYEIQRSSRSLLESEADDAWFARAGLVLR